MRKLIQPIAVISISIALTTGVAFAMTPSKSKVISTVTETVATQQEVPKEQPSTPADATVELKAPETPPAIAAPAPAPAPARNNETVVWDFLINSGFSRNQAAGIMGNLQQEHNFNTDGDGLAQWTGNRKATLLSRANPYDINTQVQFLVEELNTTEVAVGSKIKAIDNVTVITIIFQNEFERCDPVYCNQSARINYAYAILERH